MKPKGATNPLLDRYGPTALVTGASDGIGRATAQLLGEAGFDLILVARRRAKLDALATEIQGSGAVSVEVVDADLATSEGVEATLEAAQRHEVGLCVLAAGFGTSGPFIDNAVGTELNLVDVNVRAVVALAHPLAQELQKRGRGGLVFLSSLVAFQGVPRAANYAATKAFIQSFAEGLRVELRPAGVDVLSVAPGPVSSGFAQRARMDLGDAVKPETVAKGILRALGRKGTVRPGFLSKFLEASLSFLPRWARVRALTLVMAGMTKHQLAEGTA